MIGDLKPGWLARDMERAHLSHLRRAAEVKRLLARRLRRDAVTLTDAADRHEREAAAMDAEAAALTTRDLKTPAPEAAT